MKRLRIIIFLGMLLAAPVGARAALLYTSPESQVVPLNGTAVVDVRLNSEQEVVNAVEGRLSYNPEVMDVIAVSKAGSFLALWTQEPTVDDRAGTITFSGGTPHGSYVINGRLLSIVVRPKHIGASTVTLDAEKSGVYLNDGNGTRATLRVKNGILEVKALATTLQISSPTHPDENTWYRTPTAKLTWTATKDAYYAFVMGDDPTWVPDTRFGQQTTEATYSSLTDGIHYFALVERLPNDAWGSALRRRVMVDTQAPEPFTPSLTGDVIPGKRVLVFATTDTTSHVARWRVVEGEKVTENATSPYILQDPKQRAAITVSAFDAAGNERSVTLPASNAPADRKPFLPVAIVGCVLILLCGIAVYVVRRRT